MTGSFEKRGNMAITTRWSFGRWEKVGQGRGEGGSGSDKHFYGAVEVLEGMAHRLLVRYSKAVRRAAALQLRPFCRWQVLEAGAELQFRRSPLQ